MDQSNIQDIYTLSPVQEGLLFHTLAAPGTGIYCDLYNLRRTTIQDLDAFRQSWQAVVDHHPILRTSFHWEDLEAPVQVVHAKEALPFEELDWRDVPPDQIKDKLTHWLEARRRRGFQLNEAPLLNITVIHLNDREDEVVINYHHLLLDAWGFGNVMGHVSMVREQLRQGKPAALPPSRPFKDYIMWLRRQDLGAAERFWKETLAGVTEPNILPLCYNHTHAEADTLSLDRRSIKLSAERFSAVQALLRKNRLTLNTLLQGMWTLLFGAYTDADDVVFGSTVSGRPTELDGAERMVGCFINTIPTRVKIQREVGLAQWLGDLQKQESERRRFEFTPLVKITEWSDLPRGRHLFDSIVVVQNLGMGNVTEEMDLGFFQKNNYPFSLMALPEKGLELQLMFDGSRLPHRGVDLMLDRLDAMLAGFARNPDAPVGTLLDFTETEQNLLLSQWSRSPEPQPASPFVHKLIEARAAAQPNTVALRHDDASMTYGELNAAANRLAHYLLQAGAGPELIVGVCLERSFELITTLTAVLKTGAAYLPLDPAYPVDRLDFMLGDAGATLLVSRSEQADKLPAFGTYDIFLNEADTAEEIADMSAENPNASVFAENTAYIIFTSGSTGEPKGSLVPHGAVSNYIQAAIETYDMKPEEATPLHGSIGFDATATSLWAPLVNGGWLDIIGDGDLDALVQKMAGGQAYGMAKVTPAHLDLLGRADALHNRSPQVRALVVGGEALLPPHVKGWRTASPQTRIFNEYGPTEATVACSVYELPAALPPTFSLPIGMSMAGASLYLTDETLQPVNLGSTGEILIGGPCVARGYLNRPGMTADRFIPDPFGPEGSRLYRTGDLAKRHADGPIEFMNRVDHQVKLRGFRVELSEIDGVLAGAPGVGQAVTQVVTDPRGEKALAAWVALGNGQVPSELERRDVISAMRAHLRNALPEYMVPAAFVFLPTLPMTSHGKVDRDALPQPQFGGEGLGSFQAPRNTTEEMVAGIFCEILELEKVSIFDSFFDLGGHSLLATQIATRVNAAFPVNIPIRAVFDNLTIAGLSHYIDNAVRQEDKVPPVTPREDQEKMLLSFAQSRLWFLEGLVELGTTYTIPAAVRLTGDLDVDAFRRAVTEIVRRHQVMRAVFITRKGRVRQKIQEHGPVDIPVTDLRGHEKQEEAEQALIAEILGKPFDLAEGPLYRFALIRVSDQQHILIAAMHHIISDGWSNNVILSELAALYEPFCNGEPSPLPEMPIQYMDYAHWQHKYLAGEELDKQTAYWKDKLSGAPALLELPTDRPRPALQTFRGESRYFRLDGALVDQLRRLARQTSTTLFMVLEAAYAVVMSRYSGQEDVVVGTPVANRSRTELENLVGFFVNTLALRNDLSGDPTFVTLLERVRGSLLDAYSHQDLPFEQLVAELQPERNLSHQPIFQVVFALQPEDGEIKIPGLELGSVNRKSTTAKFDLTLMMSDRGELVDGVMEFNLDLFDGPTVDRLIDHFQVLLRGVAQDPERSISRLPLLTETENQQLNFWNDTATPFDHEKCMHELFMEQAARTPEETAVVFGDQSLTYRELDRRTNQLANYLVAQGVGPEVLVGVCFHRSLDTVVSVLAVQKAGGAYVPMEINWPTERMAFILKDTNARVLLTHTDIAHKLEGHIDTPVTCLDTARFNTYPTEAPVTGVTATNLAYIIFTSGSTGKPKGVILQHRPVVNLIQWVNQTYHVNTRDKLLFITSLCFDLSVYDVFGILAAGGTVFIASDEDVGDPKRLNEIIADEGITFWDSAPAALQQLVPFLPGIKEGSPSLRLVFLSGDWIPLGLPPTMQACFPNLEVIGLGGATEAAIWSNFFPVKEVQMDWNSIPYGNPIQNAAYLVLDDALERPPIGTAGDLYIGFQCLSLGYYNRPALTAERYVPDPFSKTPGLRLYNTGDRARHFRGPHGEPGPLEFLGRLDNQVKVRGFRIELGEIEAALTEMPSIRQAVVMAHSDHTNNRYLVAYLTGQEDGPPDEEAMKAHLAEKLPVYMIPSSFVTLQAMPVTPNGKLDRKALLPPDADQKTIKERILPRNDTEERLAAIWCAVLETDQVGVTDDFFEIGGHSLMATQVASRVLEDFDVEIPLRELFEATTIEGLAGIVDHYLAAQAVSGDTDDSEEDREVVEL